MTRNTYRKLAMTLGLALTLVPATASKTFAQRFIWPPPPPGGMTIILPKPTDLMDITAGAFHTCARRYDGTVYCWGLNGWYSTSGGQVGVTSTNTCYDAPIQDPNHISIGPATARPCVDKPRVVPQTLSPVSQVVAGWYHTCALSGGIASCWGSNFAGALGDGGSGDRNYPQAVSGSFQFSSLSAGNSATCGLSTSGVICWGSSFYDPSKPSSSNTPKVLNTFNGFRNFTVGNRFGCGVYILGGWGENDCLGIDNRGQLGVYDPSTPTVLVPGWLPRDGSIPYAPFFAMASTGFGSDGAPHVARSAAGSEFMCADVTDGTVQCVGSSSNGQLGNPNYAGDRSSSMPVTGGNGLALSLRGVTTGFDHACALDPSGNAWCWGSAQYGELGNGGTGFGAKSLYAQQVGGGIKFRSLAAGAQHTCGIGTDNFVYCWGDNQYGQLGVGLNTLGYRPSGFGFATFIGTPRRLDPL